MSDKLYGVGDLAKELGVTPRTLRFYESKGLIAPQRLGTTRVFTYRDRGRMILILRGKRMGFSLRDIKKFLDLYDNTHASTKQTQHLLVAVRARIAKLEEQLQAVVTSLEELRNVEKTAAAALSNKKLSAA